MSQPPDDEQDEIFSGPALGEDGALRPARGEQLLGDVPALPEESLPDHASYAPTVISPSRAFPVPPPGSGSPPRLEPVFDQEPTAPASPTFAHGPPLHLASVELAERPPPPQADFEPPPIRPEPPVRYGSPDLAWGKWLFRGLLLGALGVGGWMVATGRVPAPKGFSLDLLKPKEQPKEEVKEKRVGTPAPTLLVLSNPSGATVLLNGTEVGVTPWAGDNVWPHEPLRVEVRKAGYKPWQGLTMGGQQATLEANLRKR